MRPKEELFDLLDDKLEDGWKISINYNNILKQTQIEATKIETKKPLQMLVGSGSNVEQALEDLYELWWY